MNFDSNYFLLIVHIITWVITIIIYQKRKKHFDAGSVIIFSYLLYSIFSLFLFFDPFWGMEFNDLTLFPFIYLYLMLMIAAWPVFKFNILKVKEIQKPSNILFYSIGIIFIFCTFILISDGLPKVTEGLVKIIFDSTAGMALYNDTMEMSQFSNIGDGKISNLPSIISGLLSDLCTLMFFYYLTFKKRSKIFLFGLLLASIFPIFEQISISQRGPVLNKFLTIIISYFALRKFIPDKINKKIKAIGIIFILSVTIPIIAITSSRFDRVDSSGAFSSILFYSGQQNLFFNNYGLDNGGLRYGDRTFPMFKRFLGFDNVPYNFYERRAKYTNLKINDDVFVGFVGDFTLDFGPYVAPLIFIFFILIILNLTKTRNNKILFHQLILLHFVMCISIQGGMKLFSYADVGNLKIMMIIIAYLVFWFDFQLIKLRRSKKYSNRNLV